MSNRTRGFTVGYYFAATMYYGSTVVAGGAICYGLFGLFY